MSKQRALEQPQRFTLPCGCVAITGGPGDFSVDWCPHHEGIHGVTTFTYRGPERRKAQRLKFAVRAYG